MQWAPVRRVHVRHRVQVKVEQPVEAHKLGRALVGRVEPRHKIVLEDAEAEAAHCDHQGDGQHEQHQQGEELEAHV